MITTHTLHHQVPLIQRRQEPLAGAWRGSHRNPIIYSGPRGRMVMPVRTCATSSSSQTEGIIDTLAEVAGLANRCFKIISTAIADTSSIFISGPQAAIAGISHCNGEANITACTCARISRACGTLIGNDSHLLTTTTATFLPPQARLPVVASYALPCSQITIPTVALLRATPPVATVTLQVADLLYAVAVIVVVPLPTAVTLPLASTVATFLSPEDQLTPLT